LCSYPERWRARPVETSATRQWRSNEAAHRARGPIPADKFWKMREGVLFSVEGKGWQALSRRIHRVPSLSSYDERFLFSMDAKRKRGS